MEDGGDAATPSDKWHTSAMLTVMLRLKVFFCSTTPALVPAMGSLHRYPHLDYQGTQARAVVASREAVRAEAHGAGGEGGGEEERIEVAEEGSVLPLEQEGGVLSPSSESVPLDPVQEGEVEEVYPLRSSSASRGLHAILNLACGTHPSTLELIRARAHKIGGPP